MANSLEALRVLFDTPDAEDFELVAKLGFEARNELIYGTPQYIHGIDSPWSLGHFAHSTCTRDHVLNVIVPNRQGDKDFWLGYLHAAQGHA